MPTEPKLFKYYAFFGLLIIGAIGVVILTLSTSSDAKTDNATNDKITEVSSKLDEFIAKNSQPPATLDDAGVNNVPSTIQYTKLSNTKYQLCTTYKSASNGLGAGWTSIFTAVLLSTSRYAPPSDSDFFDPSLLSSFHHKGQNCQTITPPALSAGPGSSSATTATETLLAAKCGSAGLAFELKDETTVKSVNSAQGLITLDTTNAKLTDKNSSPITALPTINYDSITNIYGTNCKTDAVSDVDALKPGAAVTVYLYAHDSTYADQLEL